MNPMSSNTILRSSFVLLLVLGACDSNDLQDLGEKIDAAVCAPGAGNFTTEITNPYIPMPVGRQIVLEGKEDGDEIRVEITVLDELENVAGVTTRVMEEKEWENGDLVEISRNFFAQAADGTVCYFGEDVDDYKNGEITGHGGAWRADGNQNFPGIIMPANPALDMAWDLEIAPGVAEDEMKILAVGETVTVPAGQYQNTIRVLEQNRLDGDAGEKVFAPGIGIIIDAGVPMIAFTSGE